MAEFNNRASDNHNRAKGAEDIPDSHSERAGDQTAQLLLADVNSSRRQPTSSNNPIQMVGRAAEREFRNPSPDIFTVKGGPYKGMDVPNQLRCAIFQSNLAVEAGILKPNEVTVRALDLEQTLKRHGYKSEAFSPDKSYPNGTYIVGEGARDGTNSRHIAMVWNGKLIHTRDGAIVNEPISSKFFTGAYDRMTVLRRK